MNRHLLPLAALICLVSSCETATPEDYFGRAVLNLNLLHGFASTAMERQLASPSVKLVEGSTTRTVAMTRKEVVEGQITSIVEAHGKVMKLKETDDTRDMLKATLAVYEYVLPVLRNEYLQLARLYDEGAPARDIEAFQQSIRAKYLAGFQTRMEAVTAAGKPYAERHGIKVHWDVRTSPEG